MVRPCAKYARLNCEHRQKNIRRQNAVGYFLCRLAHIRAARSIFGFGSVTGRQGAMQLRAPTKNTNCKNAVGYFLCRLAHIRAVRSIFWARFYAVTKYKRAITALPKATFHACAMRKHFTRRSNDRRISCLRDSADISPPGQRARLARSDLGLGLFTVKRQRLTRRGIAFSCRRQRYCFTTNTRLCG